MTAERRRTRTCIKNYAVLKSNDASPNRLHFRHGFPWGSPRSGHVGRVRCPLWKDVSVMSSCGSCSNNRLTRLFRCIPCSCSYACPKGICGGVKVSFNQDPLKMVRLTPVFRGLCVPYTLPRYLEDSVYPTPFLYGLTPSKSLSRTQVLRAVAASNRRGMLLLEMSLAMPFVRSTRITTCPFWTVHGTSVMVVVTHVRLKVG